MEASSEGDVVTGDIDVVTGDIDVVTGDIDVVTGDIDVVTGDIDVLPDELLILIFKYLPVDAILSCENVSKRWRKLALDPDIWKGITVVYSGQQGVSEESNKNMEIMLSHKEHIYCIKFQYINDYFLIESVLRQCPNLISLELVMCQINIKFKDLILSWPLLKKINLKNSMTCLCVDNGELSIQFDHFKKLRYLALPEFGLSPTNCNTLLRCHHLSHIYIEKIRNLELDFVKQLIISKMEVLECLHIYGADSVDDACLQLLGKCPYLEDLAIIRCERLTDEGLIELTHLKYLINLQMWNNKDFSELALLQTLDTPTMKRLRGLSLSRIENVTPTIVDLISENYKKLKFLALYQCPQIINVDYKKQLKAKFRNFDVVLY